MESLQLYLNSSNADKYLDNSKSHCEWVLPMIEIPDGYHIYLSVQNCVIPYSFYNINQLITTLKSMMLLNFNINYNNINNKITFTYNSSFYISSSSTISEIIGFVKETDHYSDVNFTLTSVNNINMHPIKCINIVSNLMTFNINKSFVNNNSILCCIPINSQPYSLIEYHNNNNFRVNLFVNTISTIRIKLIDDNGNLLNLNGLNFSLTIQLDVEAFRD